MMKHSIKCLSNNKANTGFLAIDPKARLGLSHDA